MKTKSNVAASSGYLDRIVRKVSWLPDWAYKLAGMKVKTFHSIWQVEFWWQMQVGFPKPNPQETWPDIVHSCHVHGTGLRVIFNLPNAASEQQPEERTPHAN